MTYARLRLKVQPGAGRNTVTVAADGRVKVQVTSPPEGGKANKAVVTILARSLGITKVDVGIVTGHKLQDKMVLISGLSEEDALARLGNPS